ncbi:hypothetical protein WDZ11_00105 (plasmid) [Roseomonas mucosa]|uniref:hypothetical protein n=1 Tax=Roseomonas mucosa TaxID=207340 RepID=UPI0030CBF052
MFDFSTLATAPASEEGRRVLLVHTTTREPLKGSDGEQIWISMAGQDSARYRRALAAHERRVAEKRAAKPEADEAVEFDYENTRRLMADLVVGWHSDVALGGEQIAPSAENAERLFRDCPEIMEQVDRGSAGRALFLGA